MSVATDILKPTLSRHIVADIALPIHLDALVVTGGYPNTWKLASSLTVSTVYYNGVALEAGADISEVDSNAGYWFQDATFIYVSAPAGQTIFGGTFTALTTLRFCNKEKIISGVYVEPRLKTVPNISMRIEERFGGIGQISGGSLTLINSDGYFDDLTHHLWHAATVTLKIGTTAAMDFGDYVQVGKWLVEDCSRSDSDFTLRLKEIKSRLVAKLPVETYTRDTYSGIKDSDIGKPIPLAYGHIAGAKPACINEATKTFKVASHAIKQFLSVRIKIDDAWQTSTFASTTPASGEFTLGSGWTGTEEVSVDFEGRLNSDGTLMDNVADVIQDLLAQAGETDLNTASFTAARAALNIGTDNWGDVHTLYRVGLYISESKDAVELISPLIELAGAFLFCDNNGQYYLKVFSPQPSESLTAFSIDILDIEGPIADAQYITTRIRLEFGERKAESSKQVLIQSAVNYQYLADIGVARLEEKALPFAFQDDAEIWAARFLLMAGKPITTYKVSLPWSASLVLPGQQVSIEYTRRDIVETLEILEVKHDIVAGRVALTLGDLRAWKDSPGWWVADAATLPTRFSALTGYGSGALTWSASWDDQIKAWARRNVGYWTDDNGFAGTADAESFKASTWTV